LSTISLVRTLTAVCFLGFLPVASTAGSSGGIPGEMKSRSSISCSNAVYDFGTLDNEETVEHMFVLRNDGTNAVWLDKVFGCCGSTSELSSSTVFPGSDVTLRISIPLKGRSGEQAMSFYVRSNNAAWPLYELRVTGVALAKVDVQPGSVMLGAIAENAVIEKLVSITCQPDVLFNITNIACASQYITATYLGVSGNVHRVSVRTVPPLPFGITRDMVHILTDDKRYPVLEIPVLARVTKDVVVFPNEIRLTRTSGKLVADKWYGVIRSLSKTPFKIASYEVPAAGIEVVCSPMENGGYKVEISNILPQADLDGKEITLKTSNAKANDVGIPIRIVSPDSSKP